jgi:hypothetical protein
VRGRGLLRLPLVLWRTTAFGMVHAIAQWDAMVIFSDANWDGPPGTGYLTGATLIISRLADRAHDVPPRADQYRRRRTRAVVLVIAVRVPEYR